MAKQDYRIIDRYVLLDRLAEGGTATIYRAMQASSQGIGRLIVLKCFKADYLGKSNLTQQSHQQQIQVMIGLNHPNIVQFYDIGEERPGTPYIAMEYVHGRSLRHLVICLAKVRKVLNPEFIAHVGHQLAKALSYIHNHKNTLGETQKELIHRNVSPQNILISFDGEVKLIELAVLTEKDEASQGTQSMLIRGRSGYVSPEELEGKKVDPRSDIFSLGVVMWEALTGSSLFTSETRQATHQKIKNCDTVVKPPSTINKAVTKELDAIVMKALQKDPAKRFQTAHEIENALEKLLFLSYQDFSSSIFRDYLHQLFKADIQAEAEKLKVFAAEAEKAAKAILPAGKNAYLKKFQGEGDETEDTKIIMGKIAEGAVGSRNLDVDKDDLGSVEIEKGTPGINTKGTGTQRGGFVKRAHSDSLNAFGNIAGVKSDLLDTATAGVKIGGAPSKVNRALSKHRPASQGGDMAGILVKIAIAAVVIFLVLPRFGIQLWSIPSLVEKFTSLGGGQNRATATEPTPPAAQ